MTGTHTRRDSDHAFPHHPHHRRQLLAGPELARHAALQPLIAEAELHVSGTLAADGTSANLSDAIRLAEELAFVYSLECGRRPVRVVISSPVLLSVDALRSMWHISLVDAAAEAF